MGNYAASTHVTPRLGWTISASGTKPTTTQVDDQIALIEADLDGELAAQGFTVPVTDATGVLYLRQFVVAEACARSLEMRDTVTDEQDAAPQILGFREKWWGLVGRVSNSGFIEGEISLRPAIIADKIGQSFGTTAGKGRFRSYPTDNDAGDSRGAGDFDPVHTRKREW